MHEVRIATPSMHGGVNIVRDDVRTRSERMKINHGLWKEAVKAREEGILIMRWRNLIPTPNKCVIVESYGIEEGSDVNEMDCSPLIVHQLHASQRTQAGAGTKPLSISSRCHAITE